MRCPMNLLKKNLRLNIGLLFGIVIISFLISIHILTCKCPKRKEIEYTFNGYKRRLHVDMPNQVNEFKGRNDSVEVTPTNEYPYARPLHVDMPKLVNDFKERNGSVKIAPINEYSYIVISGLPDKRTANKSINLLIMVKSAVCNYERRAAIRDTWGNQTYLSQLLAKIVFVLGTLNNDSVQEKLRREQNQHGDIVQINFKDSYYNNTLKTVGAIRYATTYYRHVNFTMITDDDFYIATDFVVKKLMSYPKSSYHKLYIGNMGVTDVRRDKSYKWYVSPEEYSQKDFPPYVRSGAMIISMKLAIDLDIGIRFTKSFRFDDVYIGMVAYKLGIEPIHEENFAIEKVNITSSMFGSILASHNYSDPNELRSAWKQHQMDLNVH